MMSRITGLRSIFKTIVQFLSLANEKKLQQIFSQFVAASLFHSGGVGGIRTLAPVTRPNDLANRPLQPLEYHSIWRRGWDSNPRTLSSLPVFKTGLFNHLSTSP